MHYRDRERAREREVDESNRRCGREFYRAVRDNLLHFKLPRQGLSYVFRMSGVSSAENLQSMSHI